MALSRAEALPHMHITWRRVLVGQDFSPADRIPVAVWQGFGPADAFRSYTSSYAFLSNPKMARSFRTRIGRLIRFGCSSISVMASRFDAGNGRSRKTGLRRLTYSRKCASSMCCSRNARVGGVRLMSRSSTSIPRSAR